MRLAERTQSSPPDDIGYTKSKFSAVHRRFQPFYSYFLGDDENLTSTGIKSSLTVDRAALWLRVKEERGCL